MYHAIKTTRIYCRPECGARPLPQNVIPMATRTAAERAGYRACKRCRPELGERLRYGRARSPLGRTVVVTGEHGVRGVFFGDADAAAVYPGDLVVRDRTLNSLAAAVCDEPEVELDLRGTPFQLEVWRKLLEIPRGETRTYTQLAAELGRPGSVRAVARACATNRIGVLVPCHRVIRADGSLAGYRWGIERKHLLLELERDDLARSGGEGRAHLGLVGEATA